MPQNPLPRNVFVYDCYTDDRILVAGFMQLGHTTVAEFYSCLEICFEQPTSPNFRICHVDGTFLNRDDQTGNLIVPVGEYEVVSISISSLCLSDLDEPLEYVSVVLTPEVARPRVISGGSPATPAVES